jgi:hypothetical protein
MDMRRIERAADKLVDVFSDIRIEERELVYVAMYVVMRAQPKEVLDRVIEFGEQVKWEINNRDRSNTSEQDKLF